MYGCNLKNDNVKGNLNHEKRGGNMSKSIKPNINIHCNKGEIMTKGIFSKRAATSVMSILAFIFSVVLFTSTVSKTAMAQGVSGDSASWQFVPLEIDISKGDGGQNDGSSSFKDIPAAAGIHNVKFVSAILSATDEDKDIFGSNNFWRDGSVDTATGQGQLLKEIFYNVNTTNQGPIIANIESSDINDTGKPNEPLNMVAIIQNVSTDVVSALRSEPLGGTTAQSIINLITAEFASPLFGASVGDSYANVRPTSVTGVLGINGKTPSSLGFLNTTVAGDTINYGTVIIVRWDSISNTALKASATDRTVAGNGGLNATITINGLNPGPSNLIGLEVDGYEDATTVNPKAVASGPDVVYLGASPAKSTISVSALYDTVSGRFGNPSLSELNMIEREESFSGTEVPNVTQFTPAKTGILKSGIIQLATPAGTFNSGNPIQYRASDVVVIQSTINVNANLDGEPDAYYGTNSDPIAFGEQDDQHLTAISSTNLETSKTHLYGSLNSSGEINNASSKIKVTIQSDVDSETVNVPTFTHVGITNHGFANGAGASAIISTTFPISNSLITSTQHEKFTFSLLIQDDIGYATTTTNGADTAARTFYVDTIGPEITKLELNAIGRNTSIGTGDVGYVSQRRFSNNSGTDGFFVDIGLSSNGESTTSSNFSKWANITIDPDRDRNLQFNSLAPANVEFASFSTTTDINGTGNLLSGVIVGASSANLVPGVAGGNVIGVSATAKIFHTASSSINSTTAHVIVSVSDDARNPAIVWGSNPNVNDLAEPYETLVDNATKTYGIKTINGTARVPFVEISSASSNIVVLNNGLTGTSVFTTINSSTLAIDNTPPKVLNATLTVTGMPSGFWNDISSTSDLSTRFKTVFRATEAIEFGPNAGYVVDNGTAALENAPDVFKHYFRATAKINNVTAATSFQTQNGSPLRLIVQLDVSGTGGISNLFEVETESHGWHKSSGGSTLDTAAFQSYFNSNYTVQLRAPNIGFATDTGGTLQNLPADWTITGASIGGFAYSSDGTLVSSTIAYVTLESSNGILSSLSSIASNATGSISDASVSVFVIDRVGNISGVGPEVDQNSISRDFGGPIASSTIVVDVSGIQIGDFGVFTNALETDLISDGTAINGLGQPISGNGGAILLITNTNNVKFLDIIDRFDSTHASYDVGVANNVGGASNGQWAHIGLFSGKGNTFPGSNVLDEGNWAAEDGFLNTRSTGSDADFDNDKADGIQSGYMIIISSTFTENADNAIPDIFNSFANNPGTPVSRQLVGAFPYFVNDVTSTESISDNNFNYGAEFKTLVANFSDFVNGAKAILPQVSRAVASDGRIHNDISSATFGDIIEATWFYLIGSDASVNTSITSSDVRSVTIYARDLSGNVTAKGIRVATANFSVPTVTIESLKISVPNRNISDLAIQGTGTSALTVSAATFNKNNATMQLVAKITNSQLTSSQQPITADFTAIGGSAGVASNATSVDSTGSDVAISTIAAASVVYATWEIGPINGSIANRTAKITVTATGTSLTASSVQTNSIDTDQVNPSFQAGSNLVKELNANGVQTNSSFDTFGDGRFRPGQVFSVTATLAVGANETEGDGTQSSSDSTQFTANFSEFGLGTAVIPNSKTLTNGVITVVFQETIPTTATTAAVKGIISVTDPAGNSATANTDTVFIQAARPVVVNTILSASSSVGFASETAFATGTFTEVGTTNNSGVISSPSAPVELTRVFKNGDQLQIDSNVLITDDAFTNIIVTADMSSILNSGPTRQNVGVDEDAAAIVNLGATQVYPTSKTDGNNITAQWKIALNDVKDSGSTPQNIIINATVGAGSSFASIGNATTVVPIIIDNIAPEVSIVETWYKSGKTTEKSSVFSTNPTGATAGVIVYATFTDADSLRGYVGSVIAAHVDSTSGSTAILDAATAALISLDGSDFSLSSAIAPGLWTISDRTGATSDTAGLFLVSSGSSTSQIAATTGNVLTAWFGEVPSGFLKEDSAGNILKNGDGIDVGTIPQISIGSVNKPSANLVATVRDSVGNAGSASTPDIEADSVGPTIIGDPFLISVVPGTKHWPAQYDSAGNITSITRVGNGSQLNAFINLSDSPDKSDAMVVTVTTTHFGGSNLEVTSAATSDISGLTPNGKDYAWTFTATPSNASDVTISATFTAGSNGINSQPIDPTDANLPGDADGIFNFGYDLTKVASNSKQHFARGATVEIRIIDSESNVTTKNSIALDYDSQSPVFTKDESGKNEVAILLLNSLEEVNAIDTSTKATKDNRGKVQNANTSQWLVLAGTVVVDGTNEDHLSNFSVNWTEALEQDIGRLVADSESSGTVISPASAGIPAARSLRFVTSTVQLRTTASPSSAQDIKVTLADFFGNTTTITTDKVAVNASGPKASEIVLFVNGVSQLSGTSLLGIGNTGPDSASSSFELAPGDTVAVQAIINTVGTGRAPQFIRANFSSLYPPELLHSVDAILPSATSIKADGTVLAEWTHIAANYTGLTATNAIAFNDIQLTSAEISGPRLNNGLIAGATKDNATAITLGVGAINDLGASQAILNNLSGLPLIQVQQNADPTMSASIAVFVDENAPLNLFGSTTTPSTKFAVDTQTPIASWYLPWEHITRQLAPPITGLTGYDKSTGALNEAKGRARIGFPTTPVLTALDILNNGRTDANDENTDLNGIFSIPARVKGGDTVYIIANVTNSNITNNGNDKFRPYPGTSFDSATVFDINSSSNLDVHADLSEFGGSAFSNVSILGTTTGSDSTPAFNVLTTEQNFSGKATQISATYALTISNEVGTDVASSRLKRDATFTVIDDAGNKPYDTFETVGSNQTTNQIKKLIRPGGIGVDNRAPTISGTLDVIDLSNNNATLQNGSAISGGSKLKITANINDSVDNPLDVLNNPNWGSVSLTAEGITLSSNDVILLATEATLSGNSVSVPFSVDIPAVESGISTSEFQFRITASDSLGNATSRLSNDKFKFDARPDIKWVDASVSTIDQTITYHAGGPALVVSANSFDVGGVSEVVISIDAADAASQLPLLSQDGITFDSTFAGSGVAGTENVNVPITITSLPTIPAERLFTFLIADVTDVSGATNSANITVSYNRPAIFDSAFALTAVNSAGSDIAPATVISGSGSLETEGDIREITITEGSTVTVALAASDGDNDTIVYSATGTAFDSIFEDSVLDATSNVFTFKPGFKALTGDETSKTVDAVFTVNDSKHPTSDSVTIRITINAESAVPVVDITSINVTNLRTNVISSATVSLNDTVNIPENSHVEIVLVATDAGNENLTFTTDKNTDLVVATEITNSTGIATATVTFNLGFDDADIVISESAIDPTLLTFSASNGVNTGSATKNIDITNSSQPGVITSTYTRNGGTAQSIIDGSSITASAGDVIVIDINVADPDQIDRFGFPVITPVADESIFTIASEFVGVVNNGVEVNNRVTITVASTVAQDSTAVINYSAQKDTLDAIISTATYNIFASSTPPVPVTQIDELVLAQGAGGSQLVNIRNFDSASATPVNGIIDQFRSVGPVALAAWGGGAGRGTNVSIGDIDNDSDLDYVLSFGAINESATLPNMFIARDVATKALVGNARHAFPSTGPIGYASGELTTAIGDFLTDGTNLVAVAQGTGSTRSLVRIYQYTGLAAPNAWSVAAQFQPLDNTPNSNNANGGVTLDAADVDGDGLAELIVGQTASSSSLTQFTVIDVAADGNHVRHNFVAFAAGFRGGGGVDVAAADLNSDGTNELVFTSAALNGSTELGSLVTVVRPVVTNNVVTGYERPGNSIVQLVAGDSNPGGGLSVAAGEFDGDATNGQELLIGSGAGAPQSFYRVVKVSYDGTDVTGTTFLVGPPNNFAFTQPAFLGTFNPTSGAVNVEAANHTVRN